MVRGEARAGSEGRGGGIKILRFVPCRVVWCSAVLCRQQRIIRGTITEWEVEFESPDCSTAILFLFFVFNACCFRRFLFHFVDNGWEIGGGGLVLTDGWRRSGGIFGERIDTFKPKKP